MTDKTRSIDFTKISLKDALDLAVIVEEEAKDRYEELADQMDKHHNPEAAKFFRFMLEVEAKHESRLAERRHELCGDEPRAVRREMIFDIEAPDYDDVRANMTVRQALETSLGAETKAFEFFQAAVGRVQLQHVRDLFAELAEEEREHQELVRKQLAKLPPGPDLPISDDDDEIVAL